VLAALAGGVVAFTVGTSAAAAAPVLWGGTYRSDDMVVNSLLLSVDGGRVTLKSLQTTVQCTDTGDGRVSRTAVWVADYSRPAALRSNRFAFEFTDQQVGGPMVSYRINGTLGSNGRGTVRIRMEGDSISDAGGVIANCTGAITFQVRRGPT